MGMRRKICVYKEILQIHMSILKINSFTAPIYKQLTNSKIEVTCYLNFIS